MKELLEKTKEKSKYVKDDIFTLMFGMSSRDASLSYKCNKKYHNKYNTVHNTATLNFKPYII
jgi:hypothetical protein